MPNLFRHLTDYARSQLAFSGVKKTLSGRNLVFARDWFVAALLAMTMFLPFLTSSAFAADDEMTLSVPEYVEIVRYSITPTTGITVLDENSLKMDEGVSVVFKVYTNLNPQIYVYCTVPTTNGEINAYNRKPCNNGGKLVMTKNDGSATEEGVQNALGDSPVAQNNPNVIAFPGQSYSYYNSGRASRIAYESDISENGSLYQMHIGANRMENGQISIPGTFSPHDSAGIYTATIHITTIAP